MDEEGFEFPARLSIVLPDAAKVKMSGDRSAATAPMSPPNHSTIARSENSDLERRLLALERVFQALVAHIAEAEPKFLAQLTETFCEPLRMAQSEHDYTDIDSYAAEIVRSVAPLGAKTTRTPRQITKSRKLDGSALSFSPGEALPLLTVPCIQVRQAGGI